MVSRPFPEVFREALIRAGISQRELMKRTGFSSTVASKLLRGQLAPRLDRLDSLCEHLGLEGEDREGFRIAAILAHCPAEIRDLVERMQREIETLRRRVELFSEDPVKHARPRVAEHQGTPRRPSRRQARDQ